MGTKQRWNRLATIKMNQVIDYDQCSFRISLWWAIIKTWAKKNVFYYVEEDKKKRAVNNAETKKLMSNAS